MAEHAAARGSQPQVRSLAQRIVEAQSSELAWSRRGLHSIVAHSYHRSMAMNPPTMTGPLSNGRDHVVRRTRGAPTETGV